MLLETEVTSTNRKSPIFPWRVPLVFQSIQVLERVIFMRKTSEHPELTLEEQVLTIFLIPFRSVFKAKNIGLNWSRRP